MLLLSLLFIIIGCVFMFVELTSYKLSVKVSSDAKVPAAMWSPLPIHNSRHCSICVIKSYTKLRAGNMAWAVTATDGAVMTASSRSPSGPFSATLQRVS